jgi:hypothetical protein
MALPIDVLLCDYETTDGLCQLSAVLDELTLTYSVVERGGGRTRKLQRHMPSLREARWWAGTYGSARTCESSRAHEFPDQLPHRKP